jgi:hypothetical protein
MVELFQTLFEKCEKHAIIDPFPAVFIITSFFLKKDPLQSIKFLTKAKGINISDLLYYHIKDIVSFFYSEIPCQK